MSVINQMLKDLDQRKAGEEPVQSSPSPVIAVRHRLPLWLLIGLAGILIVWVLWWFMPVSSKPEAFVLRTQAETPATALQLIPSDETKIPQQPDRTETSQLLKIEPQLSEPLLPQTKSEPQTAEQEMAADPEPVPKGEAVDTEQVVVVERQVAELVQPQLSVERVELTLAQQQQQLRQQGLQAEQRGRTSEARNYWQQLQALAPQQAEAYVALARMAQQAGYEAGSQYWLQLGLEQGADAQQLAPLLAASYARQQLWPQVLQVLALLPETSLRPAELAMRAAAWQQLGEHQAALAAFEHLGRLEPQQGRWWLGMAISSDALGQRQQAVNQFQRSLQLGDDLTSVSKEYIRQRLQELN